MATANKSSVCFEWMNRLKTLHSQQVADNTCSPDINYVSQDKIALGEGNAMVAVLKQ